MVHGHSEELAGLRGTSTSRVSIYTVPFRGWHRLPRLPKVLTRVVSIEGKHESQVVDSRVYVDIR